MRKIMTAGIEPCPGGFGEYQWTESSEVEDGREALEQGLSVRDVVGNIIENAQVLDELELLELVDHDVWGTIHDAKPGAVFLVRNGEPIEMFWEETNEQERQEEESEEYDMEM